MKIKCSVCGTIIETDQDMYQHIDRKTDLCTNPKCMRADILNNLSLLSLHEACEEAQLPLIALQILQEGIQSLSPFQLDEIVEWFKEDYLPCFNPGVVWESA